MEFILDEAGDDSFDLQFSDLEEELADDDISTFIDNSQQNKESISFYRERDPQNLNEHHKFNNQTRKPIEVVYSDIESYFGEDAQPEFFAPEERQSVEFDKFQGFEKHAESFKKLLMKVFSVIYGLMFYNGEK